MISQLGADLDQAVSELKMLQVLQKEYTFDLIEFAKWQDLVAHRKTFCGKLQYLSGKVIAIFYII